MARSRESLIAEMQMLRDAIDGGKFKNKEQRYQAGLKVARLKYRAKKAKPEGSPKAPKSKPVKQNQGYIPGFLAGLDHVRIEELVAEKIFKKIEKTVEEKVSEMFKVG